MAEPFKLAFTDPEDLQRQIDEYFESRTEWGEEVVKITKEDGQIEEMVRPYKIHTRPPTLAGLARHLGVVRDTLWRYGNRDDPDDPFRPVIARAKNRLAELVEEALYSREGVTGARFALEVNHGYGREDDEQGGNTFAPTYITPRTETDEPLAIPKWDDDE